MSTAVNPVLYKYLEEKYATTMLKYGNIKIGDLYEYRSHWNDQIRDTEEGKFSEYDEVNAPQTFTKGVPGLMGSMISAEPGMEVTLSNVSVQVNHEIPNRNIYCTTLEGSEKVMKDFSAEACIEIFNPAGFLNAVQEVLAKRDDFNGISVSAKCIYTGRKVRYDARNSTQALPIGYWLKKQFYHPQKELRIVFLPATIEQEIKTVYLDVPGILPFIRRKTF